eukprot:jgi/Tetstr1/423987/TSEL_014598.t1
MQWQASTTAAQQRSATPEQPTQPLPAPTATASAATAMPGAHADDEEELELNYEENDNAMEVDTAQRAAIETPGSGKVTVQSGWVMEDCLHHMETFSLLNAGPLLEEARNVVTDKDGPERKAQVDALTREGRTRYPARRQGAAAGAARRQGAAAGAARRQGAAAGAARRQGAAAGAARRQDSAYSGIGGKGCITSCGRQPLKTMRSCRNNPSTGFWIPLIWLTAAGCGMQGRMTEVAVLVSPQSLHAAEAAQPHRH